MKQKLSILYKFIIVVVSFIGIYLNFKIAEPSKMILYFTIISNIMVFLFYGISLILELLGKLKKGSKYYFIGGIVTLFITLTMCVYEIALSDTAVYDGHLLECNFVHLFTPILTILDYFIFAEKGNIKKVYSVLWVIPLISYALFVQIYSALGGTFLDNQKFPYPFLDIEKNGLPYVLGVSTFFIVSFIGIGLIVYQIDKYLGKRDK